MSESSGAIKNISWDEQQTNAALMLAEGYNNSETAREVGVHKSTITRWMQNEEFADEVDRLSVLYGIASKADRLRRIKRAAREFEKDEKITGGYTYLDLLKEARMQTEGVKLDILSILTANQQEEPAAIIAEARPVEFIGSGGSESLPDQDDPQTE